MCVASAGVMPVAERMIVCRPAIDLERPEHPPLAVRRRLRQHEAAGEALARAEAFGSDLMAHRARHAVGGEPIVFVRARADRQVREDLAVPVGRRALSCATSACGRSRIRPRSRPPPADGRSFRAGPPPASTDRATSSPSSTRATTRRSTRPRPSASSGRCGTRCSRATSGTSCRDVPRAAGTGRIGHLRAGGSRQA